jgi:hypothetical protein
MQIANEAGGPNVKPSSKWTRLCALVKELFISKTVEIDRMKKTLELNLLAGSSIWSDEQSLQKRLVKINTSLVYRQDKYNLLREETEGYSKLLTVLTDLPPPPEDPSLHMKHIFAVIGMPHLLKHANTPHSFLSIETFIFIVRIGLIAYDFVFCCCWCCIMMHRVL